MPNHKSAEKRVRQSEKRRLINRTNRAKLRTSIKKLRGVLDGGDAKASSSLLPERLREIESPRAAISSARSGCPA